MEELDPHCLNGRMEAELKKIPLLPEPNTPLLLDFLRNYSYKKKPLSLARRSRLASQFHFFAKLFNKPLSPFKEQEARLPIITEKFENSG